MLRSGSSLLLPVTALRLAGRFLVPLVLWFTVGQLLRFLLLTYGTDLSLKWPYLTWVGVSLLVMISLGVTVAMLHSVRRGLPAMRDRELAERGVPLVADPDEPMIDALGRAILPFMIIYISWSFFTDDVRTWANTAFDRAQAQGLHLGIDALDAINALGDNLPVALAIAVGFWLLRTVAERFVTARLSRTGRVLTALFEINFALFGIFSVNEILGRGTGWITGRVVWSGTASTLTGSVPGWATLTEWLGRVLPTFKDAVLGPLIWLAIAGVVLGVAMDKEEPGSGRVARSLRGRIKAMAAPGRRLTETASQGTRDKWVPMMNGVRLIHRAGWPVFAVFAVLFVLIDHLRDWGWRQTVEFLGPHPYTYWEYARVPVNFGFDLLREVLRVCLLAAAFELVLIRIAGRTGARGEPTASSSDLARPTPEPAGPSSPPTRAPGP